MKLTVIWQCIVSACELIKKTTIPGNYAKNIRHHHTKFSHPGYQAPRICTSLLWNSLTSYVCYLSSFTPLAM